MATAKRFWFISFGGITMSTQITVKEFQQVQQLSDINLQDVITRIKFLLSIEEDEQLSQLLAGINCSLEDYLYWKSKQSAN
ncbi:hypothetical protein [Cylindrospermum sp. FACHB-282]|uniref:hypothetical protein n=1 Tax=Cylindrospermum sp. FACHB-282 TaxID=2692794 RepID=UPI00198C676C|nr:hypothetical protein [Cylindrospermum sp. FACHB-282]MBD2386024.1 hypothetical protein [Cylindrospermum sp. FACHB-282]